MPSKLNEGDVVIDLNGTEYTLKATLRALNMISTSFGGLAKARDAVAQQDFQACVTIIRHGLNLNDRDARTLPEELWKHGLNAELLIPLIRYIGILANGGKPQPDDPVDPQQAESAEGNAD